MDVVLSIRILKVVSERNKSIDLFLDLDLYRFINIYTARFIFTWLAKEFRICSKVALVSLILIRDSRFDTLMRLLKMFIIRRHVKNQSCFVNPQIKSCFRERKSGESEKVREL